MSSFIENGARFRLTDPTLSPNAAGYLWNRRMMLQMNCRGYAVSQYMDPEPRKYAHVPTPVGRRASCSPNRPISRITPDGSFTCAITRQAR